jgi:hypothetical protein
MSCKEEQMDDTTQKEREQTDREIIVFLPQMESTDKWINSSSFFWYTLTVRAFNFQKRLDRQLWKLRRYLFVLTQT